MEGAFPAPPPVPCCECGQPAIGMCPSCKKHVHQDYGYNGANCSGRHESKCEGARMSRERNEKPPAVVLRPKTPVYTSDYEMPVKASRNGVHKSPAKSKGKGSRR